PISAASANPCSSKNCSPCSPQKQFNSANFVKFRQFSGQYRPICGKLAASEIPSGAQIPYMADLLAKSASLRKSVLVLHGPNLNLLGLREPEHYGNDTLDGINRLLAEQAQAAGLALETFQSNSEADLVGKLHASTG